MSDAAPDDRARKGLQQWMQTLYARLGIDLTDGDPRSPAERVAAAMYPTLEPREAMLAFHDMVRQHPAGAAAADAKLRAEAATVRWHVFEPGVQRALEARADEQGVPVPEVKVQLLMAAAWELERGTDLPLPPAAGERWIERPYAVWWQKACIALAEAALRGEAPLPRAHTSDADYPLEVALEPDAGEDRPEDLADDEGTAAPRTIPQTMPPALTAYLQHVLAQPSLTDAQRERDLGKRPGWCKQQRHRLRAWLKRQV